MHNIQQTFLNLLINLKIVSTMEYFYTYYKIVDHIKIKHMLTIIILKVFYYNILLKSAHFVWLYFQSYSLTKINQVLNFDIVATENFPEYLNLYFGSVLILIAKVFNLLFFQNNGFSGFLMKEVNLYSRSMFMKSYYKFNNKIEKILKLFFNYNINKITVEKNIQNFSIVAINIIKLLITIFGMYKKSIKNIFNF